MAYPLHEKLKENKDHAEAVSEFLDFLEEKDLHIAKYSGARGNIQLYPFPMSKDNLIGMFLGIDPTELEAEKMDMLNKLRQQ